MKLAKMLSGMVLIAAASAAQAGVISVSDVTASSTFGTYNVNNLVNGAGLTGTQHDGNWENKWMTDSTVTGELIFNLGSIYDISSASIWNYGGGCCGVNRSVKDLSVGVSLDGVTYSSIGSFTLGLPAGTPFAADTISLGATAQYIKFDLNSNYGSQQYTGLSEVQFEGLMASVPEPASIALLTIGLAGLGLSRRKTFKK